MGTPFKDELYFCGHCKRQQQPHQGEACIDCGRTTVSWYTNTETAADALRKWNHIHGRR